MKRMLHIVGLALAQTGGYTGPSSVLSMSAQDLLAKGKDDRSGKITVEIDAGHFPAGRTIDQNTVVELTREFDKDPFGESTLEVKQIKVVEG